MISYSIVDIKFPRDEQKEEGFQFLQDIQQSPIQHYHHHHIHHRVALVINSLEKNFISKSCMQRM